MKYYAVPDSILHSLFEANIKEHCTIKRLCTCLQTENKGDIVRIKKKLDNTMRNTSSTTEKKSIDKDACYCSS